VSFGDLKAPRDKTGIVFCPLRPFRQRPVAHFGHFSGFYYSVCTVVIFDTEATLNHDIDRQRPGFVDHIGMNLFRRTGHQSSDVFGPPKLKLARKQPLQEWPIFAVVLWRFFHRGVKGRVAQADLETVSGFITPL